MSLFCVEGGKSNTASYPVSDCRTVTTEDSIHVGQRVKSHQSLAKHSQTPELNVE